MTNNYSIISVEKLTESNYPTQLFSHCRGLEKIMKLAHAVETDFQVTGF